MATPLSFDLPEQHIDESRPYQCQICNKRFTQKGHLMTHRRTHTGEKPYSCHICNKRFSQSSHLNTHKRIHTGEKPFYCTECGMGFCRQRRLEKHLALHNQFVNINSKIENLQGLIQPQNTSQAVFPSIGNALEILQETENSQSNRRKPSQVQHINNDNPEENNFGAQDTVVIKLEGSDNENLANDVSQPNGTSSQENNQISEMELSNVDPPTAVGAILNLNGDFNNTGSPSGDDIDLDRISITSESNFSGSEKNQPLFHAGQRMRFRCGFGQGRWKRNFKMRNLWQLEKSIDQCLANKTQQPTSNETLAKAGSNSRISLVNFSSADLLTHMMSRDDVYKCNFCCMIFQDAAMYHLHKSMHDKMDVRCCNLCGKLAKDKYDFIAHFLSEHK